ncbi:MAG: four helix bundle protein [Candidatus Taylorbacteria bacterium]|nr:four helix bundle protein [Candidatus Taylorbacteria bacterium]
MNKFRFREWQVYKDSKRLFVLLLSVVKKLPREYRFEIGSQIIRAGLSVALNIAEGSGKHSDAELNRFIDIALGSLFEAFAAVDVLLECQLVDQTVFSEIEKLTLSISDQLGGFKKRIRSDKL